ncbi:MAG TPA: hypothetical protein VNT75_31025 [Symbiobacteriaceae bacterium]|nr:hypothetical protein [Symbiobacteriaceae bacterium]
MSPTTIGPGQPATVYFTNAAVNGPQTINDILTITGEPGDYVRVIQLVGEVVNPADPENHDPDPLPPGCVHPAGKIKPADAGLVGPSGDLTAEGTAPAPTADDATAPEAPTVAPTVAPTTEAAPAPTTAPTTEAAPPPPTAPTTEAAPAPATAPAPEAAPAPATAPTTEAAPAPATAPAPEAAPPPATAPTTETAPAPTKDKTEAPTKTETTTTPLAAPR